MLPGAAGDECWHDFLLSTTALDTSNSSNSQCVKLLSSGDSRCCCFFAVTLAICVWRAFAVLLVDLLDLRLRPIYCVLLLAAGGWLLY